MATIKVTREELYEQVWATPMSKLAMRYGVSDVALAKTCRRMNIPRPGRGYWQQLEAKVHVKRIPLPRKAPPHQEWVFLGVVDNPTPRVPLPTAPEVPVAKTLENAHAAVQRLGSLLARAKVDATGRLVVPGSGFPVLAVSVATHRRALMLLDALFRALDSRGHKVDLRREKKENAFEARLVVTVADAAFEAALVERLDRRERARTAEEQRAAEFRAKLREKPPAPVYEYFASGRLQLIIRDLHGPRSSWSDGKNLLERHLGRAIVALEVEAERRRQQRQAEARARAEAEERRRQQEAEAERRRQEAEIERQRQETAEARRRHRVALEHDLRSMARRWTVAAQIRAFLDSVEQAVPLAERGAPFAAWFQWAREHAEKFDPMNEPQTIAKPLEPAPDTPLSSSNCVR